MGPLRGTRALLAWLVQESYKSSKNLSNLNYSVFVCSRPILLSTRALLAFLPMNSYGTPSGDSSSARLARPRILQISKNLSNLNYSVSVTRDQLSEGCIIVSCSSSGGTAMFTECYGDFNKTGGYSFFFIMFCF